MCLLKRAFNLSKFFPWEALAEGQAQALKLLGLVSLLRIKTCKVSLTRENIFLGRMKSKRFLSESKPCTRGLGNQNCWDSALVLVPTCNHLL